MVLQLAKFSDTDIVCEECCLRAVRTLQRVHEVDNLIGGNLGAGSGSNANLCAAGFSQNAKRLADAGAVDEGILLGIGQSLAELRKDVVLKVEGVVVQELFGNLDRHMELVSVEDNLVEGSVTEGQRTAFLYPRRSGLGGCDVDHRWW